MKKLAILDDYEHAASVCADWSVLSAELEVSIFQDHLGDEDAVAARLRDFHIVFLMRERTPMQRSLLERLPKLEMLITSGMRNLSIDMPAARALGIDVTGTPILGYPAAEHTWALLFALAKRIPADDRLIRGGAWGQALNRGFSGKTLGIVGLGRLGARVARVAQALDMQVLAWSQNLTAERCAELGVERCSKNALFERSDFVSVHLVLGERSRGLIGTAEFRRMKPTAYFVNTSRGPIVDEAALIEALEQSRIAGAGLDVYDAEPLPADHRLRQLPNTVLTPHQGYVTVENYEIFYRTAVENIRAWLDGAPINLLN